MPSYTNSEKKQKERNQKKNQYNNRKSVDVVAALGTIWMVQVEMVQKVISNIGGANGIIL